MELVRRFGGYTVRVEISAEEHAGVSLDDGLEDRTHDDPSTCDRCTPAFDALTGENDRLDKDNHVLCKRNAQLELQVAALMEKVASLEAVLAAPIAQEGEG